MTRCTTRRSHRRHSAQVPLRPAVPPSPPARTGQSPTSAKASACHTAGGLAARRARWNVGALTDEAAVGVEPEQHRHRQHCKHGGGPVVLNWAK